MRTETARREIILDWFQIVPLQLWNQLVQGFIRTESCECLGKQNKKKKKKKREETTEAARFLKNSINENLISASEKTRANNAAAVEGQNGVLASFSAVVKQSNLKWLSRYLNRTEMGHRHNRKPSLVAPVLDSCFSLAETRGGDDARNSKLLYVRLGAQKALSSCLPSSNINRLKSLHITDSTK